MFDVRHNLRAGAVVWIPVVFTCMPIFIPFVRWLLDAEWRASSKYLVTRFTALLLPFLLAACNNEVAGAPGNRAATEVPGDARAGAREAARIGCGACHVIPGITGANGLVGPPLNQIGRRVYLAGLLRNTPDNMVLWLKEPQRIVPGNAMPNMGLTERQARDITAYLYTLR
jgi:cytochrome c2